MNATTLYCPICQEKVITLWNKAIDYEYFSTKEEFNYYKCEDCGTIFIHPIPYEQLKDIYPSNYYSFVNKSKSIVVKIKEWLDKLFLRKILTQLNAKEINVLDVGGGTGWIVDILKKADSRIKFTQIVDFDKNAKAIAENKGHNYFEGTIEEFETDIKFDLILLLNLIEHVKNPLEVIKKVQALLSQNGIIVIKTPNTASIDASIFRKTYWGGLHCPRHWIIFSAKSFKILLESTNLKIKSLEYTQGAPFWAFSIIAYLFRKKLVSISADKPIIFHWLFAPLSALFAIFDFLRKPFFKTSQMFITLNKEEIT